MVARRCRVLFRLSALADVVARGGLLPVRRGEVEHVGDFRGGEVSTAPEPVPTRAVHGHRDRRVGRCRDGHQGRLREALREGLRQRIPRCPPCGHLAV
jgi:hypothetical protein